MMFYESQRIINKQKLYVKSMAYTEMHKLQRAGISDNKELLQHVDFVLSKDDNSDMRVEIFEYLRDVLLTH